MTTQGVSINSRIIPGLLVAAAGVLLTLHNLEVIRIQGIWRFWPLLLIAFGLSQMLNPNRKNLGVGVAFVVIGAFFQLANLRLIDIRIDDLWRFWPLLLIVFGVGHLMSRHRPRNITAGVFLLSLGVYFQLSMLNLIHVSLWKLWPVVLIAMGIGMVERAYSARRMAR
jgi:hypothetical protein